MRVLQTRCRWDRGLCQYCQDNKDYLKAFECEPGEDGETGTINMEVTADMSRDQVVDRVREILQLC